MEDAIDVGTLKVDDADLVRMDDDGGWQMALQPALTDGSAHIRIGGSYDTRS